MDWEKCQRNYMCKTCSSERYCNGGIEDKKETSKKSVKKNKKKKNQK